MAKPETNTRIFGGLMLLSQIIIATVHGVFMRPVGQNLANINLGA